jgi:hypothetical protein
MGILPRQSHGQVQMCGKKATKSSGVDVAIFAKVSLLLLIDTISPNSNSQLMGLITA